MADADPAPDFDEYGFNERTPNRDSLTRIRIELIVERLNLMTLPWGIMKCAHAVRDLVADDRWSDALEQHALLTRQLNDSGIRIDRELRFDLEHVGLGLDNCVRRYFPITMPPTIHFG